MDDATWMQFRLQQRETNPSFCSRSYTVGVAAKALAFAIRFIVPGCLNPRMFVQVCMSAKPGKLRLSAYLMCGLSWRRTARWSGS